MPRSRGNANQSLYLARILLAAWQAQRESGRYPEDRLLEAFLPAVKLHLRQAYGWFLLAVSGVEESAATDPPERVSSLPPPEPGKMPAPELAEFARLEAGGWLASLLDDANVTATVRATVPDANVLSSDQERPGYAVARQWLQALDDVMQRMDDSLAEC